MGLLGPFSYPAGIFLEISCVDVHNLLLVFLVLCCQSFDETSIGNIMDPTVLIPENAFLRRIFLEKSPSAVFLEDLALLTDMKT